MVEDFMVLKTPYIELKARAFEYQTVSSKHTPSVRTSILTDLHCAKEADELSTRQYDDISLWLEN